MDVEITVVPEKTEQVSPWVEAAILDVEFFRSWIKGEISDAEDYACKDHFSGESDRLFREYQEIRMKPYATRSAPAVELANTEMAKEGSESPTAPPVVISGVEQESPLPYLT